MSDTSDLDTALHRLHAVLTAAKPRDGAPQIVIDAEYRVRRALVPIAGMTSSIYDKVRAIRVAVAALRVIDHPSSDAIEVAEAVLRRIGSGYRYGWQIRFIGNDGQTYGAWNRPDHHFRTKGAADAAARANEGCGRSYGAFARRVRMSVEEWELARTSF